MAKKILVIDDEIMNLKMAQFILNKNNYDVVTASSGEEGVSLLSEDTFDLLLLDIEMPEISGFDILEKISADGTMKDMPVLILSGSCEQSDYEAGIKLGVSGFIQKPFLPDKLLSAVKDSVGDVI